MDTASLKHYLEKHPFKEMSREKADAPTYILTCPVRLQYVWFAKPRPSDLEGAKPTYQAALIIPPMADVSILKANYLRLMNERFGADWPKTLIKGDGSSSVTGGIKKQAVQHAKGVKGFYDSGYYFDATSQFCPEIVDRKKRPLDPANAEQVYAGMWCLANVKMYARPAPGKKVQNPGISFQLEALQKIADDEPFFAVDRTKNFGELDDGDEIQAHGSMNGAAGPAQAPQSIPGFD